MHSRLLAALFIAALPGCATVAPPQPAIVEPTVAAFELAARISVRQGDKLDIAKLRWTHRELSDVWVIASPIGNELARIDREGAVVVLTRANEATVTSPSFAELTKSMLGVALDPDDLARWLQGTSPPANTGWRVEIEERNADGSVRRLTAIHGDTIVKLVVDSFQGVPR